VNRVLWLVVLGVSTAAGWVRNSQHEEPFPHLRHESVFPTCTACHLGIETGVEAEYFPSPTDCQACHDGTTEERVTWSGPSRAASNLDFNHQKHLASVRQAADSVACATCHQEAGRAERMAVGPPRPDACITCHAHTADEHLAPTADCQTCHLPIVRAVGVTAEQINAFPRPANHELGDFLNTHGEASRASSQTCAVCHSQESCQRCHLNATAVPAIAALGSDARIATLTRVRGPEYPTPSTHENRSWAWTHADQAKMASATCANCHAQPSCRTCHQDSPDPAIQALPTPQAGGPAGVVFHGEVPSVHPPGWATAHGPQAGTSSDGCVGCHTNQSFCMDCHQGPQIAAFHVENFRERHSASAYGNDLDCTSCHNTEVFCRGCHIGNGLASSGRLNVAFHNAQPFWLLGHGQAARRGLEDCTACHAQSDCMRCHSAVGAWRINPHGTDFDAARLQDRNRLSCLQCHLSDPLERP